jgi:hypothetical protein
MIDEKKIIEDLKKEFPIEDQLKFDNLNIQEELQNNTFMMYHYKELEMKEQSIYSDLEDKYNKLLRERYNHYRFEVSEQLQKTEIEKYYLPGDPKIIKMKEILRKQQLRVDFFRICASAFDKRQWCMSSYSKNMNGML